MFPITNPNPIDLKSVIAGIINATGRPVLFEFGMALITCPTCEGEDPFCPQCEGNGTIYTKETSTYICTVRWKNSGEKIYKPQGQYVEGDCTVVVAYTSELETKLAKAIAAIVDGRRMVIDKIVPGGTDLNRIYVVLYEDSPKDTRTG